MKKCILFLASGICFLNLFSQSDIERDLHQKEAQTYLKKAKKQGSVAAVLAIVGGSFVSIAGLITLSELTDGSSERSNETVTTIFAITGTAMIAGSIPFFIMSGQNKRTARLLMSNSSIRIAPGILYTRQLNFGVSFTINRK